MAISCARELCPTFCDEGGVVVCGGTTQTRNSQKHITMSSLSSFSAVASKNVRTSSCFGLSTLQKKSRSWANSFSFDLTIVLMRVASKFERGAMFACRRQRAPFISDTTRLITSDSRFRFRKNSCERRSRSYCES